MLESQWQRLESLSTGKKRSQKEESEYQALIKLTEKEEDHPDFFDGACMCRTCRSYA